MKSDDAVFNFPEALPENCAIDCSDHYSSLSKLFTSLTANPYEQSLLFLQQAAIASDSLPEPISERLHEFYLHGNEEGVILLTNCPQEPGITNIPTPQGPSDKQGFVSEACLAIIAARLGQIFGYVQIENGVLFQNIVPKPGMEREQSYTSSLVELHFHTEQHFHPHTPDYLMLYCLRSAVGAETVFASVRQLIKVLDQHYLDILFEPLYRTGIDYIFGNTNTEPGNGPIMSVLYGDHKDPFLRYCEDLMVVVTPEAQTALKELRSAINKVTQSVCLSPGDLLVVDNRRVVHGRSPFTPLFNGKDRWLQRSKVIRKLEGDAGIEKILLY